MANFQLCLTSHSLSHIKCTVEYLDTKLKKKVFVTTQTLDKAVSSIPVDTGIVADISAKGKILEIYLHGVSTAGSNYKMSVELFVGTTPPQQIALWELQSISNKAQKICYYL